MKIKNVECYVTKTGLNGVWFTAVHNDNWLNIHAVKGKDHTWRLYDPLVLNGEECKKRQLKRRGERFAHLSHIMEDHLGAVYNGTRQDFIETVYETHA